MWLDEDAARSSLLDIGCWVSNRHWCPATSGNLSSRIANECFLISVSGKDKGALVKEDFIAVDFEGRPVQSGKRPSAETLLHAQIYRSYPEAAFVIHTHSVNATVLSRHVGLGQLVFRDYELEKAFSGIDTHEAELSVPVFTNRQDMVALGQEVREVLVNQPDTQAFILAGHGVYTWGSTAAEAKRHAEAMEFLLECEFKARLLAATDPQKRDRGAS